MRELEVVGVRVEMPSNNPIVLLREVDGERFLPIWIGAPEASAIAFAQQGVESPRPLTHDLLKNVLDAVGAPLTQVRITSMIDNVYHAELVLASGVVVPSRSSDAIALALRAKCPIMGAEDVLSAAGMPVPAEDEDEVERFRTFLDQVSAEDFEQTGADDEGSGGAADPGGSGPGSDGPGDGGPGKGGGPDAPTG